MRVLGVRFIPTLVHGLLDYLLAVLLLLFPWLHWSTDFVGTSVMACTGFALLLQSAFTHYEVGIVKTLPLSLHLHMDLYQGTVLLLAPWFFGFADDVLIPFSLFGAAVIGLALCTEGTPRTALKTRSSAKAERLHSQNTSKQPQLLEP